MRISTLLIVCQAALVGCGVAPTQAPERRSDAMPRLNFKLVAAGLEGDCPRVSPICEVFLTIIDNPDPAPGQGGPGMCEVAIPVNKISLHSNMATRQIVRWRILNDSAFGITGASFGAAHAVQISPNKAAGPPGTRAFENNKFTVPGRDDQYEWQSTGFQTGPNDNGYVVYAYRKAGNLACGTKDPLIVNLP